MTWKKNPAASWKLYCIIDSAVIKKRSPREIAGALFKNGADVIQLRYKNVPSYRLLRLAKSIKGIADSHRKPFLVNDRVDVALASGASGIHFGAGDLPVETARRLLGKQSIFGKTVHSIADAKNSDRAKINYLSAGPVFLTPLKRGLKKKGLAFIREVKASSKLPVFAIGGIKKSNVKNVLKHGADGICVTRAIFKAKDIVREIETG